VKRGSQRRSFRRGGFNKLSALERAPQAPRRPRDLEGLRTRRDREKLEEILLTPGQRLYLWMSGVRDAAGRQPNNPLRNTSPKTCQAACEAWHIIQQTLPPRRERPSKTHGKRGRRPQARIQNPQRTPRWSNNHQPRAGRKSKTVRGCGRTYGTPHKGGNSRGG